MLSSKSWMRPKLKQSHDVKFMVFVDLLERGIHDLETINARGNLANAYTVKMIEYKLSRKSCLEWLKSENAVKAPKDASSVDNSTKVSKFD